jgi:hypothetical protein
MRLAEPWREMVGQPIAQNNGFAYSDPTDNDRAAAEWVRRCEIAGDLQDGGTTGCLPVVLKRRSALLRTVRAIARICQSSEFPWPERPPATAQCKCDDVTHFTPSGHHLWFSRRRPATRCLTVERAMYAMAEFSGARTKTYGPDSHRSY